MWCARPDTWHTPKNKKSIYISIISISQAFFQFNPNVLNLLNTQSQVEWSDSRYWKIHLWSILPLPCFGAWSHQNKKLSTNFKQKTSGQSIDVLNFKSKVSRIISFCFFLTSFGKPENQKLFRQNLCSNKFSTTFKYNVCCVWYMLYIYVYT